MTPAGKPVVRSGGRVEFQGNEVGFVFRREGGWCYSRFGGARPAGAFATRTQAVSALLRSLGLR